MKKNIYIITAVVIIIGIIFLVLDHILYALDLSGYPLKGIFNVSFSVHNETKSELSNKLVIRAYKDKYIGKAIVTDLIGEKRISATLLPGEKKKIKEKMNLTLGLSPDKVLVSAIEEK